MTMTRDQRELVEKNIELAHFLARLSWNRNPNEMDLEEVVSVAYQGLVTAAMRWDPVGRVINPEDLLSGKAFAGFARQRILGTILDWQRSVDHVQRSYRSIFKQLRAEGYGSGISEEELARRTGNSVDKIREVIAAVTASPVSLDKTLDGTDDSPAPAYGLRSDHDVESITLVGQITSAVADALHELSPFQQIVVALRYYTGMELQAISEQLGVRLTMVREAHHEAVIELHSAMSKKAAS